MLPFFLVKVSQARPRLLKMPLLFFLQNEIGLYMPQMKTVLPSHRKLCFMLTPKLLSYKHHGVNLLSFLVVILLVCR